MNKCLVRQRAVVAKTETKLKRRSSFDVWNLKVLKVYTNVNIWVGFVFTGAVWFLVSLKILFMILGWQSFSVFSSFFPFFSFHFISFQLSEFCPRCCCFVYAKCSKRKLSTFLLWNTRKRCFKMLREITKKTDQSFLIKNKEIIIYTTHTPSSDFGTRYTLEWCVRDHHYRSPTSDVDDCKYQD